MDTPILWHIELSHYNEKVRWALDLKGVEHERRTPLPGLHGPVAMALTRSGHRRLPVLELDDRRIGDSSAIIAALDARHPEPPLYPADPSQRAEAVAHEAYFDEHLGPAIRRFGWQQLLADKELALTSLFGAQPSVRRRVAGGLFPLFGPAVRRDYDIGPEQTQAAHQAILAAMDRVEAALSPGADGGRYLVGDRFGVADLAAASLFTPLLAPPQRPYLPDVQAPVVAELREELMARPGGAWVFDMYARHRGVSHEVGAGTPVA